MGILLDATARLRGLRHGPGVWIDPRARITSPSVRVGARSRVSRYCELHGKVTIGADSFLNRDAYVRDGTTIGARVAIGPFCRFITDSHVVATADQRAGASSCAPITVGDGAWIGAGVTVLPGVSIGPGAVVAAGSLVTTSVPENTLVMGVPAKVVRTIDGEDRSGLL